MSVDFSIIIPHRGAAIGLWATIHSCEEELERSKRTYDYVVVSNGDKLGPEDDMILEYLGRSGKLRKHIHSDSPVTPPLAREMGIAETDSPVIFFFDNHCLVAKDYFERAMMDMETGNVDMLHSSTIFQKQMGPNFHYRLKLEYNFWGEPSLIPESYKTYKLAMAGHGGFAVKRDTWLEIGGYGPSDLLKGYGGEEPLFDLKLARLGKDNWINPKMIHYHYPGNRGYNRHFTDDYYINMLVAANCIGGEKWLYKVFDSLQNKSHIRPIQVDGKEDYELLEIAYNRSNEYAKYLDSICKYSLDECLDKFRLEGIAR